MSEEAKPTEGWTWLYNSKNGTIFATEGRKNEHCGV